jgi:hypothetical protein
MIANYQVLIVVRRIMNEIFSFSYMFLAFSFFHTSHSTIPCTKPIRNRHILPWSRELPDSNLIPLNCIVVKCVTVDKYFDDINTVFHIFTVYNEN